MTDRRGEQGGSRRGPAGQTQGGAAGQARRGRAGGTRVARGRALAAPPLACAWGLSTHLHTSAEPMTNNNSAAWLACACSAATDEAPVPIQEQGPHQGQQRGARQKVSAPHAGVGSARAEAQHCFFVVAHCCTSSAAGGGGRVWLGPARSFPRPPAAFDNTGRRAPLAAVGPLRTGCMCAGHASRCNKVQQLSGVVLLRPVSGV